MSRRVLFSISTPLGYQVSLDRNRWREIVRFKHPALKGHENVLRECLRNPEVVRASAKDPDVHLYYNTADRGYICVVVAPGETGERFVVTAYFTREIKKGDALWTR